MDRLCNEIIQLVLNELDDPTNFSLTSKYVYAFTQDPYVRSSYFLSRYGRIQALYWALGRGRLMNARVIDTLLSSGAHTSRYFVQCAMHHYYRTAQVPFIKTPWVRSMDLAVFTHFQTIAVRLYGNIPLGKGDDDGSILEGVIKESRFPVEQRHLKWDTLKEILEKYKFIPFCNKDAMMANFPLVLAIAPGLLSYASANGFTMDHKYRDFVFRKMFEKPSIAFEGRPDEIVRNVRELSKLDSRMFLSRTVAAEICMEAKQNEPAYNALKRLDKEGLLKFEISTVIEDLIKTFSRTRSVTFPNTFCVLQQLYSDFPSDDPVVRLVLLLQVFHSENTGSPLLDSPPPNYVEKCAAKIEEIGLGPATRADLVEVLCSKFAPERFKGILEYGSKQMHMSSRDVEELVLEVALRCLEIGCKGRMLDRLVTAHPFLHDAIRVQVMKRYRLDLTDLPPVEDAAACVMFEVPLCQDFVMPRVTLTERLAELTQRSPGAAAATVQTPELVANSEQPTGDAREGANTSAGASARDGGDDDDLGHVGQDTLSMMIRKDELGPSRGRRRFYDPFATYQDTTGKLTYPPDHTPVGRWVRQHYGHRSAVTAIFMIHAVINVNPMIVQACTSPSGIDGRVPVTLKHFKILAHLGRAAPHALVDDIESGCKFYFSEEDYLNPLELSPFPLPSKRLRKKKRVKTEKAPSPVGVASFGVAGPSTPPQTPSAAPKKRPRRSTASSEAKKYLVPDSDDELIVDECDKLVYEANCFARKRRAESELQLWVKHLAALLLTEQRKLKEQKKQIRAAAEPGTKVRVARNEFVKHMTVQLARLRKADKEQRARLYGPDAPDEDFSSGEDDEYHDRVVRGAKRRKTAAE
ncbi:hypothetical protein PHLGIDRAFT_127240 [Phlebiopsis gigantea 11061_1 CR5-6]|uniref:Uncharacterized protein n=1 Tax=Phlebiopsis gigantea (strain 11061_1 CR5-6) TaxID=745531 RepID=A0A0C3S007_PHLG1|nr:hypothetical protein PHLGIDRAFT_127240 [Phlebiopsis gigantea 11061_1 CR5-6]